MIGGLLTSKSDATTIIAIGLEPENMKRLKEGQPMLPSPSSHPFLPDGIIILIFSGDNQQEMIEQLKKIGNITPETTVLDLRTQPKPGNA